MFRRDRLRSPRATAAQRLSTWLLVTAVVGLSPWLGLSQANGRQLVTIATLALVVSGLNLSFGYAGELSFAQPAMYAVGAYVTAIVSTRWVNDIVVCLILSALAGLLLGLLSGVPGLRLGGWMLAIISLYLVLLVPDIVSLFKRWTGGPQGLSGVPVPQLFGHTLSTDQFVLVIVVVTSGWFLLFRNLAISRSGDALSVLRQSPVLASSLGIPVYATKLKAYAISGLPAAVAGSFLAYLNGFVAPESFSLSFAIIVLASSILGGARSVYGVFIGAALMVLGPMQSSSFGNYAFVAYGIFLILAGVALQRGIAGLVAQLALRLRNRGKDGFVAGVSMPEDVTLPAMSAEPLVVAGVSKHFGGIAALKDLGFTVNAGEVVALIGPNGSGKTTLLNVISGYYRADTGKVTIGGRDITASRPHRVAQAGIARTFQTPAIPAMTVREAVACSRTHVARVSTIETMLRLPRYHKVLKSDREVVDSLLNVVGLSEVADTEAQSLPLGTRRLLEVARCLAASPQVLLLDEAASGLDEEEIAGLSRIVRAVRDAGGSVLLVEHNFSLVRSLADRVVVLSQGEVVVVETPDVVAQHPEVLEHYLGQPSTAEDDAYLEETPR